MILDRNRLASASSMGRPVGADLAALANANSLSVNVLANASSLSVNVPVNAHSLILDGTRLLDDFAVVSTHNILSARGTRSG